MKLQHEREMYFMKINSSNNIATTITNKRNEVRCVRVYRPSGCWSGISLVCCVLGVWRVVLVARSRHIANCSIRMPTHGSISTSRMAFEVTIAVAMATTVAVILIFIQK